ncbi:MAG: AAA family ATPase [Hyphomicrobiales bacterium]
MKLVFNEEYKSIPADGELDIPKFVVLTGVNGAGKTQLLDAINAKKISAIVDGIPINSFQRISNLQFTPQDFSDANPYANRDSYKTIANYINTFIASGKNIDVFKKYFQDCPMTLDDRPLTQFENNIVKIALPDALAKNKRSVSTEDVMLLENKKVLNGADHNGLFYVDLSRVFLRYVEDKKANQFQKFLAMEEKEEVDFLSDEEFEELKGPPPWETINQVLQILGIPYRVNFPESCEQKFKVRLIHLQNGKEISFTELSSGEQTLARMALALYLGQLDHFLPDFVLMDEPDATLHPQMIQHLLDVLKKIIAPKVKGIIITTHSPTTCALADEECLFIMDEISRRPCKVTVDAALEKLSVGLPLISIRKEFEKQVVVESQADCDALSRIWTKYRSSNYFCNSPANLNFLASSRGHDSGCCDRTIDIVEKFSEGGVTSVFGIIDYDGCHKSSERIKVLGGIERYAIENFLLEPVLLFGLLLNRHGDSVYDKENLHKLEDINFVTLGQTSNMERQLISDEICERLREKHEQKQDGSTSMRGTLSIDITNKKLIRVNAVDSIEYDLPEWFLLSRGHDIEELIKDTFPGLKQYGNNSGDLFISVAKHVVTNHFGLLPNGIKNSFDEILNH